MHPSIQSFFPSLPFLKTRQRKSRYNEVKSLEGKKTPPSSRSRGPVLYSLLFVLGKVVRLSDPDGEPTDKIRQEGPPGRKEETGKKEEKQGGGDSLEPPLFFAYFRFDGAERSGASTSAH